MLRSATVQTIRSPDSLLKGFQIDVAVQAPLLDLPWEKCDALMPKSLNVHKLLKYIESITLHLGLQWVSVSSGHWCTNNSSQTRLIATLYGDEIREGCFPGH